MKYLLCLFLAVPALWAQGQDLTGVWRGHFRSDVSFQGLNFDDRYKIEVQIAQKNKSFQAVTYSYKTTVFYGKAEADGTVNPQTKKVLLKELKIVELRMVAGDACIMTCFLQYTRLGDEEFLQGTYTSMNNRDSSNCGKGTIFLHKVVYSDFEKEPFLLKREKEIAAEKNKGPEHEPKIKPADSSLAKTTAPPVKKPATASGTSKKPLVAQQNKNTKPQASKKPASKTIPPPSLAKANTGAVSIDTDHKDTISRPEKHLSAIPTPKVLATRQNQLVKSFTVNTDNIELNIYDNGTIDNDTVSVYFDKKLVVSNARLTEKPIVVKLHLDDTGEYHELVMVAENEGEIPPNTSLMVVKAGDKEYEVHITSTEQKNAVVVFKYEKDK